MSDLREAVARAVNEAVSKSPLLSFCDYDPDTDTETPESYRDFLENSWLGDKTDEMIAIPRLSLSHTASSQGFEVSGSHYKDSAEIDRMRVAAEKMKDFPERKPDFVAHSLELRQAVEKFLERWG